jgi:hypothetical protein
MSLLSNAPAFQLQMPNGCSNIINSICYANGNIFGIAQIASPLNGLTPTNCLLEWTSGGVLEQVASLSKPIWNGQGICWNGTNFFILGSDSDPSPSAPYHMTAYMSGFAVSYPANGQSVVQQAGELLPDATGAVPIFTGCCMAPNATNSCLVASPIDFAMTNQFVAYFDYSFTNEAEGTDAAGNTYIHNLVFDRGMQMSGDWTYGMSISNVPYGYLVGWGDVNNNWIVMQPTFGVIKTFSGALATPGSFTAQSFIGNGSGLTNLQSSNIVVSASPLTNFGAMAFGTYYTNIWGRNGHLSTTFSFSASTNINDVFYLFAPGSGCSIPPKSFSFRSGTAANNTNGTAGDYVVPSGWYFAWTNSDAGASSILTNCFTVP